MSEKNTNNLNDLEMAKKRDHKVMITEEAVNKVPRISYKEIPEEEYDNLRDYARDVLRLAMDSNDSNEVALTYTLNYRELISRGEDYMGIALGDEHSVDPLSNPISYHLIKTTADCVVIVLHNHPSLSKFSLEDIQFFLRNPSVKMMVVITNLGGVSYLVKKPSYDYPRAIDLYNDAVSIHNQGKNLNDYQDAAELFLKNCFNANIIYEYK